MRSTLYQCLMSAMRGLRETSRMVPEDQWERIRLLHIGRGKPGTQDVHPHSGYVGGQWMMESSTNPHPFRLEDSRSPHPSTLPSSMTRLCRRMPHSRWISFHRYRRVPPKLVRHALLLTCDSRQLAPPRPTFLVLFLDWQPWERTEHLGWQPWQLWQPWQSSVAHGAHRVAAVAAVAGPIRALAHGAHRLAAMAGPIRVAGARSTSAGSRGSPGSAI
jgi:hypothetical protein